MSVYKHKYSAYSGKVTPAWTRILVVARYGFAEAWSSKITVGLFILCLLPLLIALFGIYLANNPLARALIGNAGPPSVGIDASFFLARPRSPMLARPRAGILDRSRLITFDLADNALPILLSHPISRFGYVFGKFHCVVRGCSLSSPGFPACCSSPIRAIPRRRHGPAANLHIAVGLFVGAVIWITFLSILGLALSLVVKWRVVATGIIFAAVFVPAGIGAIVSAVLRTKWGLLLNLPFMMTILWQRLLGGAPDLIPGSTLPTAAIVIMLVLVCLLCVAMLNTRIRAREVVRG